MSTEIEIIPPDREGQPRSISVSRQREIAARLMDQRVAPPVLHRGPMALEPGSPVPSGHWWACITGRGNALKGDAPDNWVQLMLNGQTLEFPIGVWAVMDNNKFQVAKQSDLPMQWYEGQELKEKTMTWETRGRSQIPFRVIGEKVVDPRAALPPAVG